jgi:Dolichyl-phosphate-mannose-protein mannosyltransferase
MTSLPSPPARAPATARPRPFEAALTALVLAVAYVVALVRTAVDLGYARDEGFYFNAANSYARWFELFVTDRRAAITPRIIDGYWGVNHEHPGLIKSLFALSHAILQQRLHLFAMEGTSYRFPAMVLAGAGVGLVYLWGSAARGRLAGLAAALALALMPRFFYHAHLACFDAPIVTVWTLTAFLYSLALRDGGLAYPVLTGFAFGLALDTKHNSWFLPIVVVLHLAAREVVAALTRSPPEARAAHVEGRRRGLTALGAMVLFGPLVMYTLWPWIWHDTLPRLREYAAFHLNHEYYNMEFLGENYWAPPMPRAYAWVMTAATVPTVTLVLFVVGLSARARARLAPLLASISASCGGRLGARRVTIAAMAGRTPRPRLDLASTDLLWLLALLVSYAAWLSPKTPIFGGTKHWMTAYPFLALFAGAGFDAAVRAARRELLRLRRRRALALALGRVPWAVAAIFGACLIAAPLVETAHAHPWGLSSYTALVGGAPGAATLGLNRTFWGYTTGAVVDYLNGEASRGATIYMHDTAGPAWDMLLADGRLRRDLRGVFGVASADYGLYHHEKHMRGQEFQNWVAFGTVRPAFIAGLDGVPVILVYERPEARR